MDAASLAIGIAALYSTCRDCYKFFTTLRTAEAEYLAHVRELDIQESILKAWGFHWQIYDANDNDREQFIDSKQQKSKLHKYLLSNRFKAEGVFNTLFVLADTLSNREKLIKRYGLQLHPLQKLQDGPKSTNDDHFTFSVTTIENAKTEEATQVISEINNRLSVLHKFKWALKDKEKFKKLLTDLRSHSDSLYRLCPENAYESMNIYLAMECLAKQESAQSLKSTSKLATRQAELGEESLVRQGYRLLASTAKLKASIIENSGKEQVEGKIMNTIKEDASQMMYLGKGLALFEGQVVYVEMRDYRGPPVELTKEQKQERRRRAEWNQRGKYYKSYFKNQEDDEKSIQSVRLANPQLKALIKNFYNTFQGANMRENVYGLDMAGMIDHKDGDHKGHCSILYKLPGTIGLQSRERPAENLKLRAPVTLQSILMDRNRLGLRSPLGARFELARKLVRAVCLLHSTGWLHKNIRAESVMFFPEHVKDRPEDPYETQSEIDVSNPILMGYIFSRPDDVNSQQRQVSAQENNSEYPPPQPGNVASISAQANDSEEFPRAAPSAYSTFLEVSSELGLTPSTRPKAGHVGIYGRDMTARIPGLPGSFERLNETFISGFTLDYYQHPAKHAQPRRAYRHACDVYSLGVLLIEIGLWERLEDFANARYSKDVDKDHYELRRGICRIYLDRLRWTCGDTYADVVFKCLMMDSIDDEMGKASERKLCASLVAELENCQA